MHISLSNGVLSTRKSLYYGEFRFTPVFRTVRLGRFEEVRSKELPYFGWNFFWYRFMA